MANNDVVTLKDRDLASILAHPASPSSATAAENIEYSAEELAHIFELRDSPAFAWFTRSCLAEEHRKALAALTDPETTEHLALRKAEYLVAKRIARFLDERELVHRRAIKADDPAVQTLAARIALP